MSRAHCIQYTSNEIPYLFLNVDTQVHVEAKAFRVLVPKLVQPQYLWAGDAVGVYEKVKEIMLRGLVKGPRKSSDKSD